MTPDSGPSSVLVQASGLGKRYPKVFHRRDRLRALASLITGRRGVDSIPVLRDVDLCVRRGESLGLIGENGAGKSTLLKLIAGVLTPSEGSVRVDGRVGALLELGAGFHPEYSGRDNITMSAVLYGLKPAELRAKLEEIIAFADIGRYIDEPVKHYSSGMVVRLGFAVVAALRPDLLITDEVLAVGDEAFQKKCIRWIEDYLGAGGTLLLVSHSMYHVQKLCRHALWLRDGSVAAYGDVFDVTQAYLAYQERKSGEQAALSHKVDASQEFAVTGLALNGMAADRPTVLERGADLHVEARIHSRDGRLPVVAFGFARADGTPVYGVTTEMESVAPIREGDGFVARIDFPRLPLLPGSYSLRVHSMDSEGVRAFDTVERAVTIRGESREFGLVRLEHRWPDAGSGVHRTDEVSDDR
ncbi:MAG TPA: ABC transporter ATP-binding protein [Dokdonella sp.]|uniref:ABC transporter ATP-binding protein n=1 Tax=Dokdonella sp. TaxID=2291710 RepID=UPI002BBE65F7|nr:ABC transporter ATP-binding protein [Dokdonella sp.]HUD43816.1 ABC transporter ATP-binding protein [Dokdonella sp.]